MDKLELPPPSYDEANNSLNIITDNTNKHAWYTKLMELNFTTEEANEYAGFFATNEIDLSMIPEITDPILRTIGIDKAGHRIRILRLKQKPPVVQTPRRSPIASPRPVATPRCHKHPNVAANEKCYKCKRLVCLTCRREKAGEGGRRYFCEDCYEECTIL